MFDLLKSLRHPIFLAPMAGGPSTPELAAAVTNAGGLGALGLEYLTIDQIRVQMRRVRELTSGAIHANLFAPVKRPDANVDASAMMRELEPIHRELGIAPPVAPMLAADNLLERFDAVMEFRPELFSFTFGMFPSECIERLKRERIPFMGTATTAEEAQMLESAGADAILAQGLEAGGHRGSFARDFESAMVPTLELVRQIRAKSKLPVIASGGIMTGADIRAALDAGAVAAQLGTAFLACPESGASKPYKDAVLSARNNSTMIIRAYSGRPARGLRNKFAEQIAAKPETLLPFPLQNTLTRAMRKAAGEQGNPEYLSLWAGTAVSKIRSLPAGELVKVLAEELGAFQT